MNGWNIYCFEANTNLIQKIKKYHKNVYNYAICDTNKDFVEFNIVNSGQNNWTAGYSAIELNEDYDRLFPCDNKIITKIKVPQKTLNTIFENEINISKIDIMSIDVEGGELGVLRGLDLEIYTPTIIVVENVTHSYDIQNYLEKFGYNVDKNVHYNYFFKRTV